MSKINKQGGGQGGAAEYFTEGRGRGFDMRPERSYPKTNKERTQPVEIDLGKLNQPGKGPVNYEPRKGTDMDQECRSGGSDGDSDGDSQAY